MLYYKIKEDVNDTFAGKTTVFGGELYTLKEMKKNGIPLEWAEVASLSPRQTFFFFGSRLEFRAYPAEKLLELANKPIELCGYSAEELQDLAKEQYSHSSNPELRKIAKGE